MTRKTIVAFGDSLTAGFRCGGDDSKFVPYSAELKRRMGASKKLPKSWPKIGKEPMLFPHHDMVAIFADRGFPRWGSIAHSSVIFWEV